MNLKKFSQEDYFQYAGVEEHGTEVAMTTDIHKEGDCSRQVIVDSDGFHIFETEWDCGDVVEENYASVSMEYSTACLLIMSMTPTILFGFKLENM